MQKKIILLLTLSAIIVGWQSDKPQESIQKSNTTTALYFTIWNVDQCHFNNSNLGWYSKITVIYNTGVTTCEVVEGGPIGNWFPGQLNMVRFGPVLTFDDIPFTVDIEFLIVDTNNLFCYGSQMPTCSSTLGGCCLSQSIFDCCQCDYNGWENWVLEGNNLTFENEIGQFQNDVWSVTKNAAIEFYPVNPNPLGNGYEGCKCCVY